MREIRADRSYYDEPEATDYLNQLGQRLAARSLEARQDFEFFLIQDRQINAFALPGGFIGVNTGLLLAAQSESEVAGVMAHEISHVTQRHIARMLAQQKQALVTTLASLAAAILLSRVSSDAAQAAIAFGQAGAIQAQLNFTRDHEREADRVGLQLLEQAGFDPRGMATFFERLQRATRVYETAAPSYLRTHPLTYERIADIQNRIQDLPLPPGSGQHRVPADPREAAGRARLAARGGRVLRGEPRRAQVPERGGEPLRAGGELAARERLRAGPQGARGGRRSSCRRTPIVETLALPHRRAARARRSRRSRAIARRSRAIPATARWSTTTPTRCCRRASPTRRCSSSKSRQQVVSGDHRLYQLQARAYAALNRPLAQHRAHAEAYARLGNFAAAVEQLQIGLKSGDGDFYQLSGAEARLRELRRLDEEARKEAKR